MMSYRRSNSDCSVINPKSTFVLSVAFLALLWIAPSGSSWPVKSYRELRFQHLRSQNTLGSCGPASLATLFAEFYGKDIKEKKIIELIRPYLEEEIEKLKEDRELPEGGVSMLDLKKVSQKMGLRAKGYKIPKNELVPLLQKLATPLLLHLEEPEEHFALAIGTVDGGIVLGDPTWGLREISKSAIFDDWDGLTLAFAPQKAFRVNSREVKSEVLRDLLGRKKTQNLSLTILRGHDIV